MIYALAPVSKFNTNKLTKMRAIPQRKQHFSVSRTHKVHTIGIHLSALVDNYRFDYFQGLNLDTDASVQNGVWVIAIVQEADLIKIILNYARVWPDWVYMICYCQANWRVYQASAGTSNKQCCLPLTRTKTAYSQFDIATLCEK